MANTKRIKKFFLLFDNKGRFYGVHTYKKVCNLVQISTGTLEKTLKLNINWDNWQLIIRDKFIIFKEESFSEEEIEEYTKGQIEWKFEKVAQNKGGSSHIPNYKFKDDYIKVNESEELVIKNLLKD